MKSASCSSSVPHGSPGNERFELMPDGQVQVQALEASGEAHGTTTTRPARLPQAESIAGEVERRHLPLGLVAVHAADHDHRRAGAVRDGDDRDGRCPPRWFDDQALPACRTACPRRSGRSCRKRGSRPPAGDSEWIVDNLDRATGTARTWCRRCPWSCSSSAAAQLLAALLRDLAADLSRRVLGRVDVIVGGAGEQRRDRPAGSAAGRPARAGAARAAKRHSPRSGLPPPAQLVCDAVAFAAQSQEKVRRHGEVPSGASAGARPAAKPATRAGAHAQRRNLLRRVELGGAADLVVAPCTPWPAPLRPVQTPAMKRAVSATTPATRRVRISAETTCPRRCRIAAPLCEDRRYVRDDSAG